VGYRVGKVLELVYCGDLMGNGDRLTLMWLFWPGNGIDPLV